MRTRPKFGHGSQISFFGWCESVESNPEKAGIEFRYCLLCCPHGICLFNRGRIGNTPTVLAPFLKEVWIT
jgi:hypothetical protein